MVGESLAKNNPNRETYTPFLAFYGSTCNTKKKLTGMYLFLFFLFAVIHCLDGKANTAVLVVGLLMACGFVQSYKDGLKFFALKRCDALLEAHHRIILRYIEAAFSGPSSMIESREVSITSVVLEPVPMFSKAGDGARPFVELTKSDQLSQRYVLIIQLSTYFLRRRN